ncbi:MAG: class I SAM-dependent methyltransferase [Candidatus Omnitrophica bacterium]|nr:class I SAM-dependent methyltransferase [Candidatus Omnitrophota bacterium]
MGNTKLDIGCGLFKKEGFTGIDSFDHSKLYKPGEFILGHIPEILSDFEDNSVDEIHCKHFIEHIPQYQVIETFNEFYRILKVGCLLEIYVPPSTGRGAFCDPTHVSFWNDMSFRYYDMSWCKELSHSYGINCDFEIVTNKIIDEFNIHAILRKRG